MTLARVLVVGRYLTFMVSEQYFRRGGFGAVVNESFKQFAHGS